MLIHSSTHPYEVLRSRSVLVARLRRARAREPIASAHQNPAAPPDESGAPAAATAHPCAWPVPGPLPERGWRLGWEVVGSSSPIVVESSLALVEEVEPALGRLFPLEALGSEAPAPGTSTSGGCP